MRKCVVGGRMCGGVVVAPCGGGKTHIGVALASLVDSVIVLTPTAESVEQWREHLGLARGDVLAATNSATVPRGNVLATGVYAVVMTYARFASTDLLRAFGADLVIVDEAHRCVSTELRGLMSTVPRDCCIGLSATMVREDEKLEYLPDICGPELARVHLRDLVAAGLLSRVRCKTVLVRDEPHPPIEPDASAALVQQRLVGTNLNKLGVLRDFLSTRGPGDRTVVFVDDIWSLRQVHKAMLDGAADVAERVVGPLCGLTGAAARKVMLQSFADTDGGCIFVGRVLDEAWDARANALVQMSTPWGSRRQIHQRLGRVQRGGAGHVSDAITICCPAEYQHVQRRDEHIRQEGYEVTLQDDDRQECSIEQAALRLAAVLDSLACAPSPSRDGVRLGGARKGRSALRDAVCGRRRPPARPRV